MTTIIGNSDAFTTVKDFFANTLTGKILSNLGYGALWLIGISVFMICLFGFVGIQTSMELDMIQTNFVNVAKAIGYAVVGLALFIKFLITTCD